LPVKRPKVHASLRLDADMLDWFKAQGRGRPLGRSRPRPHGGRTPCRPSQQLAHRLDQRKSYHPGPVTVLRNPL
jgi:hypothetical protein